MINKEYVVKYLLTKCKNLCGTLGMAGNIQCESGFKTNNLENKYEKQFKLTDEQYTYMINCGAYTLNQFNDSAGFGLCQWTTDGRKTNLYTHLFKYCQDNKIPFDISNLKGQCEFLIWELKNGYKKVWGTLCNATDIRQASDMVLTRFEVPAAYQEKATQDYRYQKCLEVWKEVFNEEITFWFELDGGWYYVYNGVLQCDKWEKYKNTWYHLDENGKMNKCKWLTYKNDYYYVNDSGVMLTNAWVEYEDGWYYLGNDGKMMKNCTVMWKDKPYILDNTGKCI